MRITHKGPADTDLSQLVQNEKNLDATRRSTNDTIQKDSVSAKVNISKEARELQRIADLARKGDELRAEKVSQIKNQIAKGEYKAEAEEVAQSILRSEVSRLLEEE